MTDGGFGPGYDNPDNYVWLYNVDSKGFSELIPPILYPKGPRLRALIFSTMAATPDRRRLYVGAYYMFENQGNPLSRIDLATNRVTAFIQPFDLFNPDFIALGPVVEE